MIVLSPRRVLRLWSRFFFHDITHWRPVECTARHIWLSWKIGINPDSLHRHPINLERQFMPSMARTTPRWEFLAKSMHTREIQTFKFRKYVSNLYGPFIDEFNDLKHGTLRIFISSSDMIDIPMSTFFLFRFGVPTYSIVTRAISASLIVPSQQVHICKAWLRCPHNWKSQLICFYILAGNSRRSFLIATGISSDVWK